MTEQCQWTQIMLKVWVFRLKALSNKDCTRVRWKLSPGQSILNWHNRGTVKVDYGINICVYNPESIGDISLLENGCFSMLGHTP